MSCLQSQCSRPNLLDIQDCVQQRKRVLAVSESVVSRCLGGRASNFGLLMSERDYARQFHGMSVAQRIGLERLQD